MLQALTIRDVVLIDALTIEFAPGLCVLTGETGAGKSILLDGLALALGMRADATLVRSGTASASVTATFAPAAAHPVGHLLAGQDIATDEAVLLRRSVKADGGSRAWINDQPVSVALLRTVAEQMIEIHGQQDDRGLLDSAGHRDLLDAFGGLASLRGETAQAHGRWKQAREDLALAREAVETADRDREWLLHATDELRQLAPQLDEEQQLADARAQMQRGERLGADLEQVDTLLSGPDGGVSQLRQAARRLERIAAQDDRLTLVLATLDRAVGEALDAEGQLAAARQALAFDPEQLETTETRLFDLRAAARKYRCPVEELPIVAAQLSERFAAIEGGQERLAALESAEQQARNAFAITAQALGNARQLAARRLDAAVAGELAPLKLDAARFRTVLSPLPEADWSAAGAERVSFEIATNPGAPFGPLAKIASGGELSRFVLALKVALAEGLGATTLIFDEIDRGVGGAVAAAIGERLARLAREAQVIVVTHSPQVAARADRHWRIVKTTQGGSARTDVILLDEPARQEEIARMLSGDEVTDEARAQAARLLAVA